MSDKIKTKNQSQHKWLIIWDSTSLSKPGITISFDLTDSNSFKKEFSKKIYQRLLHTLNYFLQTVQLDHSENNYNLVQCCKYFCQELSLNCTERHLKAIGQRLCHFSVSYERMIQSDNFVASFEINPAQTLNSCLQKTVLHVMMELQELSVLLRSQIF